MSGKHITIRIKLAGWHGWRWQVSIGLDSRHGFEETDTLAFRRAGEALLRLLPL